MDAIKQILNKYKFLKLTSIPMISLLSYYFFKSQKKRKVKPLQISDDCITKEESQARSRLFSVIKYTLILNFDSIDINNNYQGRVDIEIDIPNLINEDIVLDFSGLIQELYCNSQRIANIKRYGNKIHLKSKLFKIGINKITVNFESFYNSKGMYYSTNNRILFSNIKSYSLHNIFPCFDQIDITSDFKLSLLIPSEFEAFSCGGIIKTFQGLSQIRQELNNISHLKIKPRSNSKLMEFDVCKAISLFSIIIVIGDFHILEYQNNESCKIPMRFITHKSKSNKVNYGKINQIFQNCSKFIDFYCKYFNTEYPFKKLDIFFLKDKIDSKCANIILNINHVLERTLSNVIDYSYLNYAISFNLSQIWLGTIVTCNWLEDRYLQEAIRTYVSFISLEEEGINFSWQIFNFFKLKAYILEESNCTHKLNIEIMNSRMADLIYDEITLFKFSSYFKYFSYLIGQNNFRNFIRDIYLEFKLKKISLNTFKDGLNKLNTSLKRDDLRNIFENFLESVDLPKLELDIQYQNKIIKSASIKQNNRMKYYLHLQLELLLIYSSGIETLVTNIFPRETNEIIELYSRPKPLAIIINYNDNSYVRQIFDDNTAEYLITKSDTLYKYPLAKFVVNRDFYLMVRDAYVDPLHFLNYSLNILREYNENDVSFVNQVLSLCINTNLNYMSKDNQLNGNNLMFNLILDILPKYPLIREILLNYLLDVINTSKIDHIHTILSSILKDEERFINEKRPILNLENLSFNTKLRVLEAIFESDVVNMESKIQAKNEFISFDSNFEKNQNFEICLDACLPDFEKKKGYFETLVYKDKDLSLKDYEMIMRGTARKNQLSLIKKLFKSSFINNFEFILDEHGEDYARKFYSYFSPSFINTEPILKKMENLFEQIKGKSSIICVLIRNQISQLRVNLKVINKFKISYLNSNSYI